MSARPAAMRYPNASVPCDATYDAHIQAALIHHTSDVITILAADGTIRFQSSAVLRTLGYTPDELLGTNPFLLIHPDDVVTFQTRFRAMVEQADTGMVVECRCRHQDGTWRWLEAIGTNLLADPTVAGILINARDITGRKAVEATLTDQAFSDPLTGLPNRNQFLNHLAKRQPPLTLLYLDLDGFKVVNDSLGHAAGDQLLVVVGQRLVAGLRPNDVVARLGGDEFAILLAPGTRCCEVEAIATRLLEAVQAPIVLDHGEAFVTASIGIATTSIADGPAGDLLRAADIALYQAKARGRAQYAIFTDAMNVAARARLALETDLRRAVARGEFQLRYQPKVALGSGQIMSVEALLRWDRPGHGLVPPEIFLAVAEEVGLMRPIGCWVITEVCRQARAWETLLPHGATAPVSVNLAAQQLRHPALVAHVAAVLDETGLAPQHLMLEITERALVSDVAVTSQILRDLKDLGVQLAIDDFGTGASSLSFLQRMANDVDMLKLDRSFVQGLDQNTATRTIVGAIVSLAHALGLDVTIEGIETAEELAVARSLGCDFGQGYYFAPPQSAEAVVEILACGHVQSHTSPNGSVN